MHTAGRCGIVLHEQGSRHCCVTVILSGLCSDRCLYWQQLVHLFPAVAAGKMISMLPRPDTFGMHSGPHETMQHGGSPTCCAVRVTFLSKQKQGLRLVQWIN